MHEQSWVTPYLVILHWEYLCCVKGLVRMKPFVLHQALDTITVRIAIFIKKIMPTRLYIDTTGVLQMVRDNIPPETQALIAKFQQGVFIPSVVLCFILLCYSVFFLFINGGICNYIVIELVSIISLLFCVATFVIQYIVYDQITAQIDGLKKNLFGGLINDFISIQVTRGVSVWLSLAAFILLFLTSVFILFSCCLRRKRAQESYEMDQI